MKKLRKIPQGSGDPAEQSVMSVADSTSNFGDHVPSSDWVQDDIGDSVGSYEDDRDDDESETNRFYGNFVFNRRRPTNPELPSTGTLFCILWNSWLTGVWVGVISFLPKVLL